MHAASVHPEPGSNSQTNCISSAVSRSDSFELFILAFFTFLELCSLWFWQILFSHLLFALYFFYLLFNCQVSIRSLCESLSIISLLFYLVKRFFKTFSKIFSRFFQNRFKILFGKALPSLAIQEPISRRRSARQLVYSTTSPSLCQYLFWNIFGFLSFCDLCRIPLFDFAISLSLLTLSDKKKTLLPP